jgi:AraC family transcriptional regulator of arabinose operon
MPCVLYLPPAGRPRWVCPASAQLDLLYLGWGKRRFGQSPIPQSRHPGWVYFLVRTGTPQLHLETNLLRTRPGQVLLVGPDCASGWTDAIGSVCELLTWVWRTPPRCVECAPPSNGWREFAADAALQRALQHAHVLCREEVERPSPLTKPALEHARLHIDLALARSLQPRPAAPEPALRLELALRWLAENLATPNPVASLCEYLQVSPVTLNRLFRSHLREGVAAHHARLRMEHARQLLTGGQMSVKEVAFAVGYRHANDFSRAFKRFTGYTPAVSRGGRHTTKV